MTKSEAKLLRVKLGKALGLIEENLGYKLVLGTCRYGVTATFKLECRPISEDGEITTKEAVEFKRMAHHFGLAAEDLGKTFVHLGNKFKVVGLVSRRPKYPILAKRKDGKQFKFPASIVAGLLHP